MGGPHPPDRLGIDADRSGRSEASELRLPLCRTRMPRSTSCLSGERISFKASFGKSGSIDLPAASRSAAYIIHQTTAQEEEENTTRSSGVMN